MHPTIEATETTPEATDHSVRDFDELDDHAQTALHEAADGNTVQLSEDAANSFEDGELVRFTGYYRVDIAR